MKLSICIPTYNRARLLENCLQSLVDQKRFPTGQVEICISDNASDDVTADVVARAAEILPIRYHRKDKNLGIPRNFLHVVSMARGEFVWMVGDDDLFYPNALERVVGLIAAHQDVNYFFVNAAHLHTDELSGKPHPYRTEFLPTDLKPFSAESSSGMRDFFDLIDPEVVFDFLGGIFLSVFRKSAWDQHVGVLNSQNLSDPRMFSHFDNTFPHLKVFAHAFSGQGIWFEHVPASVCLTGARGWAPMYPLIHGVRLVEALEVYRATGLPSAQYHRARNETLHNFIPELINMWYYGDKAGYAYVEPLKLLWRNRRYPNVYLSLPRFFGRRIRKISRLWGG